MLNLIKQLQKLVLALYNLKKTVLARSAGKMTGLKPELQVRTEQLISEMFKRGHAVMVFQGFRSFEEQDYLYAQGRTRRGAIVTNAKAGQSNHNYGTAVDIVFLVNGNPSWDNSHPWSLLGEVGEAVGLEWGGNWTGFVDRPHFQLKK